jgi:hypothetical protein
MSYLSLGGLDSIAHVQPYQNLRFQRRNSVEFYKFYQLFNTVLCNKLEVLEGPVFEILIGLVFRLNSRVEQEQMHTPPFVKRNTLPV